MYYFHSLVCNGYTLNAVCPVYLSIATYNWHFINQYSGASIIEWTPWDQQIYCYKVVVLSCRGT